MKLKKKSHTLVVGSDKRLYSIGGNNGRVSLNNVEVFNPRIGKWMECANLNMERESHYSIAINDRIFTIGGSSNGVYLDSMEVYKIGGSIWEYGKHMKNSRADFAAIVTPDEKFIYVMGGYNGKVIAECERYDILNNKWEELPNMINKRHMHAGLFCPW